MPVFDFSARAGRKAGRPECTYTTFQSSEPRRLSPEKPILILDNSKATKWQHHVLRNVYQSGQADDL